MIIDRRKVENGRLPDFIVIGAMKCGTSTLHEQLDRQPWCFMTHPKEPNFFSDNQQYEKGLYWYASLFSGAAADLICGESSTHYTKLPTYPECARRLHAAVPNVKLVYVMRDPVERIVSHYIHEWSQHVIEADCPIDRAIEEYPILVSYSQYATQLRPYIDLFGFDAILPVFFECLINDPQREFDRIASHIGYTGHAHWVDDGAKNISAVRQRRHPALSAILDIRMLQLIRRSLIPEPVRARIRARWTMKERPRLSPNAIAHLHQELDPDIRRLGKWLGIPLDCDTFKRRVAQGSAPEWIDRPHASHG